MPRGRSKAPVCQYCSMLSVKVKGTEIYPHRADLKTKVFYLCWRCDAYVGCHPNSEIPLGVLANAELREAKKEAHLAFDRLWKEGSTTRSKAYTILAMLLDIAPRDAHIGQMTPDMCRRVVQICTALAPFTEDDYQGALAWAKQYYPLLKVKKQLLKKQAELA